MSDDRQYTSKDIADTILLARIVEARHALATALRLRRRWDRATYGSYPAGGIEAAEEAVAAARRRVAKLEKLAKVKP